MKRVTCICIALMAVLTFTDFAEAQRRGGGGRGGGGMRGGGFRGGGFSGRSAARPNIHHRPSTRPSPGRGDFNRGNINRGNINRGNINRGNINTGNINRGNINTGNINRDINIDRDYDGRWGYYGDGCCYPRHPIAAGVAVGAAAAAAASIGSVVYTLPPSCTTTVVDGIAYNNCDGTWYEPQFVGTTTQYVVVEAPDD